MDFHPFYLLKQSVDARRSGGAFFITKIAVHKEGDFQLMVAVSGGY